MEKPRWETAGPVPSNSPSSFGCPERSENRGSFMGVSPVWLHRPRAQQGPVFGLMLYSHCLLFSLFKNIEKESKMKRIRDRDTKTEK